MLRSRYGLRVFTGSLVIATVTVIIVTSAALTKRFWAPLRERAVANAVFESLEPPFWWPPSWCDFYDDAEPIFRAVKDKPNGIAAVSAIADHVAQLKNSNRDSQLMPLLDKALDHNDCLVRKAAIMAIHEIGSEAKEVLPSIIKAIDDDNAVVAFVAAIAVRKFGSSAEDAVPALGRFVMDQRQPIQFRLLGVRSLRDIGPHAVPVLVEALREKGYESDPLKLGIIMALGEIGPGAHDALPELGGLAAGYSALREVAEASVAKIVGNDAQ